MLNSNTIEHKRTRKGSILIFVLIVVATTTVLAFGFAYRTRIEIKLVDNYAKRTYAHYLALGGLERLLCLLEKDPGDLTVAAHTGRLGAFSTTATKEELFKDVPGRTDRAHDLQYSICDEAGLLNINTSDPACWAQLDPLTKESAACILDWVDEDDDAGLGGAETAYYEKLSPSYRAKNAKFILPKELLYIKDISAQMYTHRSGLDHEAFSTVARNTPVPGLLDIFTTRGNGQININTAPKYIIASLPGLNEFVADALYTFRAGFDGQLGTDDDVFLESGDDILKVPGVTELQAELLGQYCCFSSAEFRLYSRAAMKGGVECRLMGSVKYQQGKAQLVSVERIP